MFGKKKKEKVNIHIDISVDKDGKVSVVYPTDTDVNFSFTLNDKEYFGPGGILLENQCKKTFKIPVGKSKSKAEVDKILADLILDYSKKIDWYNLEIPQHEYKFTVNGKEYTRRTEIKFQKDYWFPNGK